jgi:CheY-like chemotaxis protein/anti-sigma regulatory factor (Ser/Thr protein kinase)
VAHLTRLVDDLLDVARITRGRIELKPARVELAPIVGRALEMASPLLAQRANRLIVDVAPTGLAVHADADRMAQVISNLLTNAAKYSDANSSIAVQAERDAGIVRLRVRDRGVGIAPEKLEHVFDLFVQMPQTIDRSIGGLGLGLTIVRAIVEMHGGSVRAESAGVGSGSEFVVELPAAASAPAAAAGTAARADSDPGAVASTSSRRVLIVDDNADAALTLAEALRAYGHTVAVVHDGPAALQRADLFQPNVALVDIGLPVMNGYEVAGRLRALRAELRLIAISGYGQEADRRRSEEAGFERHLVKPVSLEALRALLEIG